MFITDKQLLDILAVFDCTELCIEKRETLVEMDVWNNEAHIMKHYEKVYASEIYVVKFLHLSSNFSQLWQAQAEFAELYREEGIPTPKHMSLKNEREKYVYCCQIQGEDFIIMLETWAGERLADYSEKIVIAAAGLLGKMHAASCKRQCFFRPGRLYREVCSGNTDYLSLWKKTGTDFLPEHLLKDILNFYGIRFYNMLQIWKSLPKYTVQGDLYRMNLTVKENQLQVIDYDRMGDEVLLADLLQTWFRFWYDEKVQTFLTDIKMEDLWKKFLRAYERKRMLTIEERQALPDLYAVFGSIYCTKMLAQKAEDGNKQETVEKFPEVLKILKISEEML